MEEISKHKREVIVEVWDLVRQWERNFGIIIKDSAIKGSEEDSHEGIEEHQVYYFSNEEHKNEETKSKDKLSNLGNNPS